MNINNLYLKRPLRIRRGMTLVELLVVTALTALIGFGVYRAFASGVSVWRWVERYKPRGDAAVFLDRFAEDVRRMSLSRAEDLIGSASRVSFFVENSDLQFIPSDFIDRDLKATSAIVRVEYIFLPHERQVVMQRFDYGASEPQVSRVLLEDVNLCEFQYYVRDRNKQGYKIEYAVSASMPRAIKVLLNTGADKSRVTSQRIIVTEGNA